MRQLTAKQKKILKGYSHCHSTSQLPDGVFEALEKINDTEILYQEIDRFLRDEHFTNFMAKQNSY